MGVMIILLGASLLVGIIFLIAFIWSVKSGQFEDDFSPAHKILFDTPIQKQENEISNQITQNNQSINGRNKKHKRLDRT